MNDSIIQPVPPGEILLEDFLKPLALSPGELAKKIHVDIETVHSILNGTKRISGDTALRLSRFLGTSPEVWMNLQAHYELEVARDEAEERIRREVLPLSVESENAAVQQA
jgi:addiction module HigA family antidote